MAAMQLSRIDFRLHLAWVLVVGEGGEGRFLGREGVHLASNSCPIMTFLGTTLTNKAERQIRCDT